MVSFFFHFGQSKLESAALLFWDQQERKYRLFFPFQEVSSVACRIIYEDSFNEMASRYFLAGEFHSHHFMPPRFSSVDNDDEKGTRLFGVFGIKEGGTFSINLRAGSGGCFIPLEEDPYLENYTELLSDCSLHTPPEEFLSRVTFM